MCAEVLMFENLKMLSKLITKLFRQTRLERFKSHQRSMKKLLEIHTIFTLADDSSINDGTHLSQTLAYFSPFTVFRCNASMLITLPIYTHFCCNILLKILLGLNQLLGCSN